MKNTTEQISTERVVRHYNQILYNVHVVLCILAAGEDDNFCRSPRSFKC